MKIFEIIITSIRITGTYYLCSLNEVCYQEKVKKALRYCGIPRWLGFK